MMRTLLIIAASCLLAAAIVLSPLAQPAGTAPKKAQSPAQQPDPAGRCPTCSAEMITVPILIGMPTTEMARQLELGRVLLGGCVYDPSQPQKAVVYLKCRKSLQKGMKHWRRLPKDFGKDARAGGRS